MGPLTYVEGVRLVRSTLIEISAYGPRAELAILMIIAHESGGGRARKQIGGGPARGIIQMEPPTFDSTIKFGEKCASYLRRAGFDPAVVRCADLEFDDRLSVVMARARLAMDPGALPDSPPAMAAYLKKIWNGPGKATPEKYLNDWEEWKDAATN